VRPLARESVWLCLSCGTRFRLAEARPETNRTRRVLRRRVRLVLTRRVRLVREEGQGVSSQYGREGGGGREPMLAGWRRLPNLMPGAGRNRFSGGVGVSAAAEAAAQSGASNMLTTL
jgi:hypothetical protein